MSASVHSSTALVLEIRFPGMRQTVKYTVLRRMFTDALNNWPGAFMAFLALGGIRGFCEEGRRPAAPKGIDGASFGEITSLLIDQERNLWIGTGNNGLFCVRPRAFQGLMTFLTNHLTWSPESVAELYRCRWGIEVFFKQIKQTLQLADFLGTSANAVRWQIWTALLVYLLLRYLAFLSDWAHSFSRLFAIVRTCLWRKWDLLKLLACYGTAGGSFRYLGRPEQAFFPGFI